MGKLVENRRDGKTQGETFADCWRCPTEYGTTESP
jgi:hypothetical protein